MNGLFFGALGSNVCTKSILVASSVIFETVKIFGLSLTIWCFFTQYKKICFISALAYVILFAVSVLASISVLNMNVQQNNSLALLANDQYQSIESQISIEKQSIAILQRNANIDSEKGYRKRSNATIARIQQKQDQLSKLVKEKATIAKNNSIVAALAYLPQRLLSKR